ncbi:MAG: hypothetical protein QOI41_1208, partial [Myxococcales bacterium]|nr:hypothetical protein [Myxococcales bacterium]
MKLFSSAVAWTVVSGIVLACGG